MHCTWCWRDRPLAADGKHLLRGGRRAICLYVQEAIEHNPDASFIGSYTDHRLAARVAAARGAGTLYIGAGPRPIWCVFKLRRTDTGAGVSGATAGENPQGGMEIPAACRSLILDDSTQQE